MTCIVAVGLKVKVGNDVSCALPAGKASRAVNVGNGVAVLSLRVARGSTGVGAGVVGDLAHEATLTTTIATITTASMRLGSLTKRTFLPYSITCTGNQFTHQNTSLVAKIPLPITVTSA